jgi:uncharacterized membrane protein YqiK
MQNVITLGASAGLGLFVFVLFLVSRMVRYVGNNRVAVVEKLWSQAGSVSAGLIALEGEAGYQPDAARRLPLLLPFQYRIHSQSLVTIPQGQIGYIFARDGAPLGPTQTLASNAATADFLDVRAFLTHGGQKGRSAPSCVRAPMPSTPRNS